MVFQTLWSKVFENRAITQFFLQIIVTPNSSSILKIMVPKCVSSRTFKNEQKNPGLVQNGQKGPKVKILGQNAQIF